MPKTHALENSASIRNSEIKVARFWQSAPNSKYEGNGFESLTEGNLTYHSPQPNFFFYGTANGPLPCTNVQVISYFKRKYGFVPQWRSSNPKDGFYSQKVSP